MKAFLKENMVLAAGIALPLLLALIFFGATQMGKATIDPPRYSVIFAADYYHNNNNYPYNLVIEKDQLRFVYIPPEEKDSYHNWQKPRLFVYNPVKNESHEVALPNIKDKKKKIDEVIEDIHAQKLSSLKESPDGFVFDHDYRGGGNLMTELFGGGYRSRSRHVLRKASYSVPVPKSERYNSEFIGWIIEPAETADD
ncbi:MAG: hypothetical protein H6859_05095 [Rhodospirillales bacterium]|nr:hypothetical protein [Alphaproteobacteria bacterium]USO06546.1 MAG: hypothetical protein H6859_05095 [Rhodospirillales bacterium]